MKQFLLYLLYVGILFLMQIVGLVFFGVTEHWPFWKTDVGSFFETIHILFYMVPAGLFMYIAAIAGNATAGLEGDPATVWVLWALGMAVVAFIYALLIGAVLWLITFVIKLIGEKAFAK
jgi:hypothetical protein